MAFISGRTSVHGGLTRVAQEVLAVLYQHRLMTVRQLHALLQPGRFSQSSWLREQLHRLRHLGLVAATLRLSRYGQREQVWYCTPAGADLVEAGGEAVPRPYRMTEQSAASALQEHTLAVNDTALQFVESARRLGHECGPLDWEMERAHRVRDGSGRGPDSVLIPDAVLSYVRQTATQRTFLTWFLELDRATETTTRLAAKLRMYARYLDFVPTPPPGRPRMAGPGGQAWRERYAVFPRVLVVLTGAAPHLLARRTDDLRALAEADVRFQRAAGRLLVGVTTFDLLSARGPFEPIVTPLLGPEVATDVLLGAAPASQDGRA